MIQHKNHSNPEFPKPGEGVIPTELIIDKVIPNGRLGVDITQDLSAVHGADAYYEDNSGEKLPVVLDATLSVAGEKPRSVAAFRKEIKGGPDDGKVQLLIVQKGERDDFHETLIEAGSPFVMQELGVGIQLDAAGKWANLTTDGTSRVKLTGNVPKTRPFNDEYGPLAR